MAQAMVEKDMKTFPLSEVLHVTVTKQSQVQFTNKPAEKAISETSVNFTIPHWVSYVTIGRPRIGMQSEKEYRTHSSTMETVRWPKFYRGERNTYQVHLMTFTAKGAPKRDLCVYLTGNEYHPSNY